MIIKHFSRPLRLLQRKFLRTFVIPSDNEKLSLKTHNGETRTITRGEYKLIIPKILQKNWNNGEKLADNILLFLQDKFYEEVLSASQRLLQIDVDHDRAYNIRAIVLMKNQKYDEAIQILETFIKRYGKSVNALTNLSKAYYYKGNEKYSRELIIEALHLNPNQEYALEWWIEINQNYEDLQQISKIKGAWLPKLYEAKLFIESDDINHAINLYKQVLKELSGNIETQSEALKIIIIDLCTYGYYQQVISIVAPIYNPYEHPLDIGVRLFLVYIELKDIENAEKMLKDIKEHEIYEEVVKELEMRLNKLKQV